MTSPPENTLPDKVREWLGKSGYALELEAAAAFAKASFHVDHSTIYSDPESGKGREIDVIAELRGGLGVIRTLLAIECKSSDKPWVVLTDSEKIGWGPDYSSLGVYSENASIAPADWERHKPVYLLLNDTDLRDWLKTSYVGGFALRQAFSKKDSDPAYEAAMSALKASVAVVEGLKPPRIVFCLPVIVVDAPIFECRLDRSGEIRLRQVDRTEFSFAAMIPEPRGSSIHVVSRAGLKSFAGAVSDAFLRVREVLAFKEEEFAETQRKKNQGEPG